MISYYRKDSSACQSGCYPGVALATAMPGGKCASRLNCEKCFLRLFRSNHYTGTLSDNVELS